MNLSKTAKRFLSSTMAIALAGGSVLAFRNSALADPPGSALEQSNVGFTLALPPECALEVGGTAPDATKAYSYDTFDAGLTTSGEDRATNLTASQTIKYDCNSDTVSIRVSSATSSYNGGATPTNATALTASHAWEWGKGTSATTGFTPTSGNADLDLAATTDANGDIEVSIKSTWTADGGAEELLAATYTSSLSLDVTANQERYISSNSLD